MKDIQIELNRVWPEWRIIEQVGKGAYGEVYRIERCVFSPEYVSALKVIEIPYSQEEVIAARTKGMSEQDVTAYFYNMLESIVKDLALMSKLCGICNIVSYQNYAVTKKEDEFGWIIFIRMEFLTNLSEIMMIEPLRGADAIQIGMDICRALEVCEQNHIIHRDIKPENIFRSKQGDYKLGDIGIIRHLEKTMSDIPTKEPVSYMAPEVYYRQPYNGTADIYSLGIILYRLFNNGRFPFLPAYTEWISSSDMEQADQVRLTGKEMPDPCNADNELSGIIKKACAYSADKRYKTADELLFDLQNVLTDDLRGMEVLVLNPKMRQNTIIGTKNPKGECFYCGKPIRYLDKYCVYCGKANEGWRETSKNQCGNCHEYLQEGDKYCRYCGTEVGKGAYDPYQDLMQCIYGPMPENRTHICSNCGFRWDTCTMIDNEMYCPKCGGDAPDTMEKSKGIFLRKFFNRILK